MTTSSDPADTEIRGLSPIPLLLLSLILCGLAGAMAWGIRGQFGHETGAMIFGPLVGFTLVMLYFPGGNSLKGARAVALLSMAVGIGGSMSYGETIGLTQDYEVHRQLVVNEAGEKVYEKQWNDAAYWWGMLGLAIKGGLWMGVAGLFLGMGLGDKAYDPLEIFLMMIAAVLLLIGGIWLLNTPYQPAERILPYLYFSDDWRWEPAEFVNPRPENWGGVLLPYIAGLLYLQLVRKDRLGVLLGLWGFVAGLGFPIGQSLQAANAFDPDGFRELLPIYIGKNSWNLMECTFGLVAGTVFGFAVWFHRNRISRSAGAEPVTMPLNWEICLLLAYLFVFIIGWRYEESALGRFHEFGLVMAVVPATGIIGGRYWPFLYALPVVAMPIAVKAFRAVGLGSESVPSLIPTHVAWPLIIALPLLLLTVLAIYWARRSEQDNSASRMGAWLLLATTACYYVFNFLLERFPWHWFADWTLQTPTGMIYFYAWLILSIAAILVLVKTKRSV
ncbi:MAG: hypothetical protein CMJ46_01420 [Planctomyces sp.]|nr:hypothetical protein [Planctomyces sp.]